MLKKINMLIKKICQNSFSLLNSYYKKLICRCAEFYPKCDKCNNFNMSYIELYVM